MRARVIVTAVEVGHIQSVELYIAPTHVLAFLINQVLENLHAGLM